MTLHGVPITEKDLKGVFDKLKATVEYSLEISTTDWYLANSVSRSGRSEWTLHTRGQSIWGPHGGDDFVDLGHSRRQAFLILESIAEGVRLATSELIRV